MIKFIDFTKFYKGIRKEILKEIDRVLLAGELILRRDVEKFEKKLAKFVGIKYCVGLNSGTDALFLSLKAAGIKEGDEVITSNYTFIATHEAIVNCGAKLVLVDFNEDFLIDVNKIEEKITDKTKAIIPVYIAGAICNLDKIMEIAQKHNLIVIEDACQALGAKGLGRGLTTCFSHYPAKILGALGDAGSVCTNNQEIADKIRLLRNHCGGNDYGYNSRLDNVQAAILNIKFKYLKGWLKRRKEIARMYDKGLKDIQGINLPIKRNCYQDYIITAEKRDDLKDFLAKKGIETLIGKYNLSSKEGNDLRLPCNPDLANEEVLEVIKQIKLWKKL